MLHTPGCQPLHVFKLSRPVNDGFCAQPVHPEQGRGFLLEFGSGVDPDPKDPLVRVAYPDRDPSIIKNNLDSYCFVTSL